MAKFKKYKRSPEPKEIVKGNKIVFIKDLISEKMTKIMIIGGAGFIGFHIAKELLSQGDEVVIYDAFLNFVDPLKSHYGHYIDYRLKGLNDRAVILRGDIRHKGHFLRVLKEHKPSIVIYLAALPIATAANKLSEDAMEINLNGTVNVLESLRECSFIKRFVYTSSSMVYGNFIKESADEEHPCNPLGVYGGTKLAGEILTKVFSKQLGFEYTIIRPSAVYGPTDSNRRVTQIFVENALMKKPLILHNGGKSKLDFTYVEDIAHGIILAAKSDKSKNETFNITRGESKSLREFVDILAKLVPDVEIKEEDAPDDEKRPERGTLDISKARKLLEYEPKFSLEEGLKRYVEFVKSMGILKKEWKQNLG